MSTDDPTLVEFAEMVRGEKLREHERSMLEAAERGEKLPIDPVTGERYFDALIAHWYTAMRSNAEVTSRPTTGD